MDRIVAVMRSEQVRREASYTSCKGASRRAPRDTTLGSLQKQLIVPQRVPHKPCQ